jgi:hypothetical protein
MSNLTHLRQTVPACFLALLGLPVLASAQNEAALKAHFEGRQIAVRIDMPGAADGVDLEMDKVRRLDHEKYQRNLRRYGISLRAGDLSLITLVKLKDDLVEIHLGGGGYGTFSDDTSTTSNIKLREKSGREKDLEDRIDEEKDSEKRRAWQRELNDLRDRRERENRRLEAERERDEEFKRQRLAERRLHGGSRFNLRYEDNVPRNLAPEDIVAALNEYVDFAPRPAAPPPVSNLLPVDPASADVSAPRKGMLRDEAERAFGRPTARSQRREGNLTVAILTFETPDRRITADFVEDVLIRYTVSSK